MTTPLSDLTVLEVSGGVATRYCGKLFVTHGARVLQTYQPDNRDIGYGGAATAAYAPWLDDGKQRASADAAPRADLVIAGQAATDIAAAKSLGAGMTPRPLLLALTWFGTIGPMPTGSPPMAQSRQ
jgi:hypothetical protein